MEVEESAKRPPSEMNIIRDYVKRNYKFLFLKIK